MAKTFLIVQLAVLLVFGLAGIALAAPHPDTGPGCGLGKLAWSEYANQQNIAPQVMMATTNGTFGSTTFGISSGTSGCTNDGVVMGQHKANTFAAINFDNLAQEMARGEGEHLASLAELMGIEPDRRAAFYAMAQERYVTLIEAGEESPVALIRALNDASAGHPVLAQAPASR